MKNITQLSVCTGGFSFSYNICFEITPETSQRDLDLIIGQMAHPCDTEKQRDALTQTVNEYADYSKKSGKDLQIFLYGYDTNEYSAPYNRYISQAPFSDMLSFNH